MDVARQDQDDVVARRLDCPAETPGHLPVTVLTGGGTHARIEERDAHRMSATAKAAERLEELEHRLAAASVLVGPLPGLSREKRLAVRFGACGIEEAADALVLAVGYLQADEDPTSGVEGEARGVGDEGGGLGG